MQGVWHYADGTAFRAGVVGLFNIAILINTDMTNTTKRAVILLSGGMDSATTLAIARSEGFECYALSFLYGQRHVHEIEASKNVAAALGVKDHRFVSIDLRAFGGSALTDDIDVPKNRAIDDEIPITYVPARNTIFLSYALGFAEVIGAYDIFIGVNAVDYSGYPDCRPEFIQSFEQTANLATAAGVTEKGKFRIRTPLIDLTKAQIIAEGINLGVDYGLTLSCYDPSERGEACGQCDACQLRLKGFKDNAMSDPAVYVQSKVKG